MADDEAASAQMALITRDLEETIGTEALAAKLAAGGSPRIYWGTATTGKPHFGYMLPMMKLSDMLEAGATVVVLFADLHAALDALKTSFAEIEARCRWYEFVIRELLKCVGVPLERLEFVTGTDYQLSREYTLDVYKMTALTTSTKCIHAGAEVVKSTDNPLMSGLLYPILQALDEEYLKVDAQFGGVDQRKIFTFAREQLPKLGYAKRAHLLNPLIPSLSKSGKMSASDPSSRLDFDDSPDTIREKLRAAFCAAGVAEGNGVLALMRYVVFRWLERSKRTFKIVKEADGSTVEFAHYDDLEKAYVAGEVGPKDLKTAVGEHIVELLAPVREAIAQNQDLLRAAYPDVGPAGPNAASAAAAATADAGAGAAAAGAAAPAKRGPPQAAPLSFTSLRVVVGQIKSVKKHEKQPERLYVVEADVGEDAPRTLVSGLVQHVTEDELNGARVLVATNVAAADIAGQPSNGMVLAAQTGSRRDPSSIKVALLSPPEDAKLGEVIVAEGETTLTPDAPAITKARMGKVIKLLSTDKEGVPVYKKKHALIAGEGGPKCTCTLSGASVQ